MQLWTKKAALNDFNTSGNCIAAERNLLSKGPIISQQSVNRPMAKPMETNTGLMTVTALNDDDDVELAPRFAITWTMTRPTTSSIIAAPVRTTPSLVLTKPVVDRMVNVVPRLVEQSAAPAAKACSVVTSASLNNTNDNPIGAAMPVIATRVQNRRFAFNAENDVDNPPVIYLDKEKKSLEDMCLKDVDVFLC